MFLLLSLRCIHDNLTRSTNIKYIDLSGNKRKPLASKRERIRIQFDFDLLGTGNDKKECKDPQQYVNWQDVNFPCRPEDIITKAKREAIVGTMENVKRYLESIFFVDPVEKPFKLEMPETYFSADEAKKTVEKVDLHLTVVGRPYGYSTATLASAIAFQADKRTRRPIQGGVFINANGIPEYPQDINSYDNSFFLTCVHEIFHVMGYSSKMFNEFHPRNSLKPHKQILCNITDEYNKKHIFLVTPYAQQFARMQYGVKEFSYGDQKCPPGIEMEDGGGDGTEVSHPEGRTAMTDLMVGASIKAKGGTFMKFTSLSMAVLLDTGFYDIDYTKVHPLIWGNKATFDDKYDKNFAFGPPGDVFPAHYFPYDSYIGYIYPGFDFKTLGGCNPINRIDCSSSKKYDDKTHYCASEGFYNSKGKSKIGNSWIFDFQLVHFPYDFCKNGYAAITGMDKCHKYTISPDGNSFSFELLKQRPNEMFTFECNETNQEQMIKYEEISENGNGYIQREIMCPNVQSFIKTVKMYEDHQFYTEDPFTHNEEPADPNDETVPKENDSNPNPNNEDTSNNINQSNGVSSNKKNTTIIIIAVVSCVVVIIAIAVGVFLLIRSRKKHVSAQSDSTSEEVNN